MSTSFPVMQEVEKQRSSKGSVCSLYQMLRNRSVQHVLYGGCNTCVSNVLNISLIPIRGISF